MSIYFERKIHTTSGDVITHITWYKDLLLAVSAVSQGDGGYINIFNSAGEATNHINTQSDRPVSALAWHPRGSLFAACDGGMVCMWFEDEKETYQVESPHRAPITSLVFSPQGGRLISADIEGGLVGWNSSGRQLLTAYHHQFTDAISHIVYRNIVNKGADLRGAAKAAVAGDEQALDMFTNLEVFTSWRPKTASVKEFSFPSDFRDNQSFFAVAVSGAVFFINDNGRCQEVLDLGCVCRDILYRPDTDQLLILTDTLAVAQFSIKTDGSLQEILKVKLSGGSKDVIPTMIWTKSGLLAVNTGTSSIRLWNLDTGDSCLVTIPDGSFNSEYFTNIAFSSSKGVLCGGTNSGNLCMWKLIDDEWERESGSFIGAPIKHITWGVDLLAVNTLSNLYILKQQPLSAHFTHNVGCVQKSGNHVVLLTESASKSLVKCDLTSEIPVHGLTLSDKYVALWNDKLVVVYQFSVDNKDVLTTQVAGTFSCVCEALAIFEESLILMEKERTTLRTIQGTIKQTFFFVPVEGLPIVLNLFQHFVTIATNMGFVKVFDVSRREAKNHGRIKNMKELIDDFGEVMSCQCNSSGTQIALTVATDSLVPDTRLYALNVENDSVQWFDFATGETYFKDDTKFTQDIDSKMIVSHCWDHEDPRLLVCHLKSLYSNFKLEEVEELGTERRCKENLAVVLWSTKEKGLLLHEKITLTSQHSKILALSSPHVILLSSQNSELLDKLTTGDFTGVTDITAAIKQAVLSFSYYLAVGNTDLAFKVINCVASDSVWTNLAKSCVKSKRLDVAAVCMGRVLNGRVAKALRESISEPELEARVAILAIHLGMLDEAENLLKSCGRYDLLNKFYQTTSNWSKAVETAETKDRIHLRNTYHMHGKHLEQVGRISEALACYEKAETDKIHGPRLLLEDPIRLKSYIDQANDPLLYKWMAQYMESTGEMDAALQYYTLANDNLSIVRVLCFLDNYTRACEIARGTGDKAAAYHLARQFETMDKIDEALDFFTEAQAYGNAIRICKEQGLTDRIWNLAWPAGPREQVDAANYLREQGDNHKAILLYHKAGMMHKALDLAFSCGDAEALSRISTELTNDTDPVLLEKTATFFLSNQEYGRAVDLLATAGKYSDAVSLCVEHSVPLTEELAERLNPTGPDRNKLLIQIGECALAQNSYHLATKKFTQAGDKVRAMKALLKSGDTDKIIFLAGVSREKDVYIMAANYLQALDWRSNPQILNTIIQFYSKAKAYQALANFYVACSNVEVEEYQDYEKAVVALSEAKRCLNKLHDDQMVRKLSETIDKRISMVQHYLRAKRSYDQQTPSEGLQQCRQLLVQLGDHESTVRPVDVFVLMLQNEHDVSAARKVFEEMKKRVTDAQKFLPSAILDTLGYKETHRIPVDEIDFEVQ